MSHLPGKKRTDDLNRRLNKPTSPEESVSQDIPEDDALPPLDVNSSPKEVQKPSHPKMKKSERATTFQTPEPATFDDTIGELPVENTAESESAPTKRYASGQINTEDLGDVATADEVMEDEWSEKADTNSSFIISAVWIVLGLILIIAVVTIAIKKKPSEVNAAPPREVSTEELFRKEELLDREERKKVEAIYNQLTERLQSFLRAKTLEEKATFIRQPDRVVPLMKKYYETNEIEVITDERFSVFTPATIDNRAFWITALENEAGGEDTPVLIEQTENDELLIDWETFVTYQAHDWDQLVKNRPAGEYQMRVKATYSDYFLYEFSDRSKWGCLYLTGRGGEEDLYGFYELDKPFVEELRYYLARSRGKKLSIVATMTFPQDTKAEKSAIITDIKSFNWVFVEPIEEELAE